MRQREPGTSSSPQADLATMSFESRESRDAGSSLLDDSKNSGPGGGIDSVEQACNTACITFRRRKQSVCRSRLSVVVAALNGANDAYCVERPSWYRRKAPECMQSMSVCQCLHVVTCTSQKLQDMCKGLNSDENKHNRNQYHTLEKQTCAL